MAIKFIGQLLIGFFHGDCRTLLQTYILQNTPLTKVKIWFLQFILCQNCCLRHSNTNLLNYLTDNKVISKFDKSVRLTFDIPCSKFQPVILHFLQIIKCLKKFFWASPSINLQLFAWLIYLTSFTRDFLEFDTFLVTLHCQTDTFIVSDGHFYFLIDSNRFYKLNFTY